MERISGPFGPYFIAAYTVEAEGRYFGYAKICVDEPRDIWTPDAIDKVAGEPQAEPLLALQAAEQVARRLIDLRRLQWPTEWTSDWL
jgi:hypothetical protein